MAPSARYRIARALGWAGAIVFAACSPAWAWPWEKNKSGPPPVELIEMMKAPAAHLEREVRFSARFAMNGKLFKPLNTAFNPTEHINFAVWPIEAELWDRTERRNVLPTLYIDKTDLASMKVIQCARRYDVLCITARVSSAYAGLPWLRIKAIETVNEPSEALSEVAVVHVSEGLDLLDRGSAEQAAKHLELALADQMPERHRAYLLGRLGEAKAKSGNAIQAVENYSKAVERDGEDAALLLEYAKSQIEAGQVDGALISARKALSLEAGNPDIYGVMGEALGRLGQTTKGLEQCELAAGLPGGSPEQKAMAQVYRARVLAAGRRYADAVLAYAAAVRDTPLTSRAWLRKEIGRLYESRFDESQQIKLLEEAAREYGNANALGGNTDPEGLLLSARAAFKRAQTEKTGFEKAKEALELCAKADPSYLPARLMRAEIALAENNLEEAKRLLQEATEAGSEGPQVALQFAKLYEKAGRAEEARAAYASILATQPKNREALDRHAALSERTGDFAGAKKSLGALAEIDPNDLTVQLRLGLLLLNAGEADAAMPALQNASRASGLAGESARVQLARLQAARGDVRGAEAMLRGVLVSNAEQVEALSVLAVLLADQGRRGEPFVLAQKAVGKAPEEPAAIDALGWAQASAGQSGEAVATLERIPVDRRVRATWYHLGAAQKSAGNAAAAREALGRAAGAVAPGEDAVAAEALRARARALLEQVGKDAAPTKPVSRRKAPVSPETEEAVAEAPAAEMLPVPEEAAAASDPMQEQAVAPIEAVTPATEVPPVPEEPIPSAEPGVTSTEEAPVRIPGIAQPEPVIEEVHSLAGPKQPTRINQVELVGKAAPLPIEDSLPPVELFPEIDEPKTAPAKRAGVDATLDLEPAPPAPAAPEAMDDVEQLPEWAR